jgi:hypothetical protein
MHSPYADATTSRFYNLLFCDEPSLFTGPDANGHSSADAQGNTNSGFQNGAANAGQDWSDPRWRLLRYRQQAANGQAIAVRELLGMVVEIGMDHGLEVLASYPNGSHRYINQLGSILIWEATEDQEMQELTSRLFAEGLRIMNQIGPWDQARRPAPTLGMARISMLGSDGIYFGEAGVNQLFRDPLAAPALQTATQILRLLVQKGRPATGNAV